MTGEEKPTDVTQGEVAETMAEQEQGFADREESVAERSQASSESPDATEPPLSAGSSPGGEPEVEVQVDVVPASQGEAELDVEVLKQEREALSEQLAAIARERDAAQLQLDEFKAQYARLAADFDNFRKRTQKEKADLENAAKCSTIKELLSVVDNFERAREQIRAQSDGEKTIHKSYQSIYKQMVDCLKRLGVSPMRPVGEEFDPTLHEAVMRQQTNEHSEGTVLEELMRGYMLNDIVLRHAMVKVAAPLDTPSEEAALGDGSGASAPSE